MASNQATVAADQGRDAGDLASAHPRVALPRRLRSMPGRTLHLIALDPGAPEDIPAFCRVTSNELVRVAPDSHAYWIRSRTDWT